MVGAVFTDEELRVNHRFVVAFETLRKAHGHREMHDGALHHISDQTGLDFRTLRTARHLRNALAHGETVNRQNLVKHLEILDDLVGAGATTPPPPRQDPPMTSERRAYRLHAWKDPRLEDEMSANGFVSVGGDELGDLAGVTDPEAIRTMLTESMPDRTPAAIGLFVGYWRRFLWDAVPGDLAVLPLRTRAVRIGEFVGPYHYVASAAPRARHRRVVSWFEGEIPREAFGRDLLKTLNGQHTVQDFKVPNAVARLEAIAANSVDPGA